MRQPVARKVKYATLGSAGGLGVGKMLSNVLMAFGLVTQEQGDAVSPMFELLSTVGGTFLGGYLVRETKSKWI